MKNLVFILALGLSMAFFAGCDDSGAKKAPPAATTATESKPAPEEAKVEPVESELDKAAKAAEAVLNDAADKAGAAAETTGAALKDAADKAEAVVGEAGEKAGAALKDAAAKAEAVVGEAGEKAGAALKDAAAKAEAVVGEAGEKTGEALKDAADKTDAAIQKFAGKPATDNAAFLKNKKFVLKKVDGADFAAAGLGAPWIEVGEDLSVVGKACNNFRGAGELAEGRLTVKAIASTRMACADDALGQLENKIFTMLENGADVVLEDSVLTMSQGGVSLVFEAEAK